MAISLIIIFTIFLIILIFMFIIGFNLILKSNYNNIDKIIKVFEDNQKKERDIQHIYLQDLVSKTGNIFEQLDKLLVDINCFNHGNCVIYDEHTQKIIEKVKETENGNK